jgi:hypothetical protein
VPLHTWILLRRRGRERRSGQKVRTSCTSAREGLSVAVISGTARGGRYPKLFWRLCSMGKRGPRGAVLALILQGHFGGPRDVPIVVEHVWSPLRLGASAANSLQVGARH